MNLLSPTRSDPLVYTLISNGFATYVQIRDELSIEETLDLYEMCLIRLHNKASVANSLKRTKK